MGLLGGSLEHARSVQARDRTQALHQSVQERGLGYQLTAKLAAPLLGGAQSQRVASHGADSSNTQHGDHHQPGEQRGKGVIDKELGDEEDDRRQAYRERCQRCYLCDRRQPLRGISR